MTIFRGDLPKVEGGVTYDDDSDSDGDNDDDDDDEDDNDDNDAIQENSLIIIVAVN